ncbi:alpha/beta fold hydrolase [Nocardioides ferulae]|uniref:alpha/beta fold hydrolase n=1 Tax=Nocardioides ferulae TaxID=2340821 RepID=UPI0013DDD2FC|nr:alpha/beta fold hydrolase [Nocardioides ferulae]
MTEQAGAPDAPRVEIWGEGEPVLLVHGSIATGAETWEQQRPLAAEGFALVVPDRRGYGRSAALAAGEDYEVDAHDIVDLLAVRGGAHLVGHSYGGIGALLAAALRPDAVRSLVVVEPPAFAVAAGHPAVDAIVAESVALWARDGLSDRAFVLGFLATLTDPTEVPEHLVEHWTRIVGPLRRCRPPWAARVPLAELAAARFPKVVVSGGHHAAFDATCEALAAGIGAELVVVTGAEHEVQATGAPFNDLLREVWGRAPAAGR